MSPPLVERESSPDLFPPQGSLLRGTQWKGEAEGRQVLRESAAREWHYGLSKLEDPAHIWALLGTCLGGRTGVNLGEGFL